jgi:hypothetical protein
MPGPKKRITSTSEAVKVGQVAEKLMGVAPSASAVSSLNQTLTEQYSMWRERPLLAHYRILYLDGVHFSVRHGTQTDSTIILTALRVDQEGNKDVLAVLAEALKCSLTSGRGGLLGLSNDKHSAQNVFTEGLSNYPPCSMAAPDKSQ